MFKKTLLFLGLLTSCTGNATPPEQATPSPEASGSALDVAGTTAGQATTRTEFAGRCGSGECWGDPSTMVVVENGGTCYLFDDITALVTTEGETQVWRRPGQATCVSESPDITWDGSWQGRFGDYLIGYREMGSDHVALEIYDKATGKSLTALEVGQTTPTITTDDVLQFNLPLTEWTCPEAGDPGHEACASEAWGAVTQAHPDLAAHTPPACECSSDDGMPASMFSRVITADFTIDLKTTNFTPKLASPPTCKCTL